MGLNYMLSAVNIQTSTHHIRKKMKNVSFVRLVFLVSQGASTEALLISQQFL